MRSAVIAACVLATGASAPVTIVRGYSPLPAGASVRAARVDPAITTIYPLARPRGVMATSGGWAYCEQVRTLARRTGYTLLCGRYYLDGYLGLGLRDRRHLDWGDAAYLSSLADKIRALHRRVGGQLILIGVSYSGFGVAALAAHHPELRPDRLIVIDSFFDLVARRKALPDTHPTAREIDQETGSTPALQARSATAEALARLVQAGTRLTVIWSIAEEERRYFNGATCDREANADTLAQVADKLRRPIPAWVTENRHGHDLWDHGPQIIAGHYPGRQVVFHPGAGIPAGAVCSSPSR